ncbi:MAG: hypothetical protein H0W02_18760 [Ktedonobacteraceae bacterium]|nr:hypothetical protein [Ktedonobacteraceae bacterium]
MPTSNSRAAAAKKRSEPRLKNYRSDASLSAIFEAIRLTLASHKAKRISFDYDDAGQATSIQFVLEVHGTALTFRLPARFENVERLVAESNRSAGRSQKGDALRDQAMRTTWANIRDWLSAQMALIDAGMVQTEEVFLPYLLNEAGQTYFEVFQERLALPAPRAGSDHRVTVSEGP